MSKFQIRNMLLNKTQEKKCIEQILNTKITKLIPWWKLKWVLKTNKIKLFNQVK